MSLDRIHSLIDAAEQEPHKFPPTLIFNEGWMLRLLLHWFSAHETPGRPLEFLPGANWFSEALLPSPFRPRHRGDPRAEARTHADGLVGHIAVGTAAKADARLRPDATQFVVAEAKMNSRLSAGTRNAPSYDQAARNVACMSEMLSLANVRPIELKSFAFFVCAPRRGLAEGLTQERLTKDSIDKAVRSRAQAYSGELDAWLQEWFTPSLDLLLIRAISWEDLLEAIAPIDPESYQELVAFYERCLHYNVGLAAPA